MQITLTTPALLFPAVSLLLLAYTNRFLALASLIRSLHTRYNSNQDKRTKSQIETLRKRVTLVKQMQFTGILSLLFCVVSMCGLYAGYIKFGELMFAVSLAVMMWSLILTLIEIQISVNALNVELEDMEDSKKDLVVTDSRNNG